MIDKGKINEYIGSWMKADGKIVNIPDVGRNDLATMFGRIGFKTGVEIGTERGKFAKILVERNKGLVLFCIDPYLFYDGGEGYKTGVNQKTHDDNLEIAMKTLKKFNAVIMKKTSQEALDGFEDDSLDFVYIDGNHRLDHVVQDLTGWVKKVKKGGIVAGHDYIKPKKQCFTHVPYALDAYMKSYGHYPLFVLDQKNSSRTVDQNKKMDRVRSWFFVKQ